MAEEWRTVARRVPAILAPIHATDAAPMDSRLPNLLHRAYDAIRLRGGELAGIRHKVVAELVNPPHQPDLPFCALLARANEVLRQHHRLHCEGSRILALYGERLGFLQPAPASQRDPVLLRPAPAIQRDRMAKANAWWEGWLRNRLDAIDSKREVSRKIRLAAAYEAAMFDAVRVAGELPASSQCWDEWAQAAEFLAGHAEEQTSSALHHALRMSLAVAMESHSATSILGCT